MFVNTPTSGLPRPFGFPFSCISPVIIENFGGLLVELIFFSLLYLVLVSFSTVISYFPSGSYVLPPYLEQLKLS